MSTSVGRAAYRGLAARDIALIALFAALIAALSMPVAIPVPGSAVPITLQTLGVMLAPSILGAKRGTLAVLTFLVLVAAGLPLLPGGRGGIAPFLGATGGYMVGWIFGALAIGLIAHRVAGRYRFWTGILANAAGGIGVIYLFGIPWTAVYTGDRLFAVLVAAFAFLPGDLVKAVAAAAIAAGVHRAYPIPPAGRRASEPENDPENEPESEPDAQTSGTRPPDAQKPGTPGTRPPDDSP